MIYEFKPIQTRFRKSNWKSIGFSFDIKFFDGCAGGTGLQFILFVSIYYDITIWIKPFGEIILK